MTTLANGSNVTLTLGDFDSVTITTRGVAIVSAVSGLGVAAGRLAEYTGTRTFGPYTAGSLNIIATAADLQYEFADGIRPSVGGGSDYLLPVASASVLGGVKAGTGVSIAGDGTLTATGGGSSYTLPAATSTVLGGVKAGSGVSIAGDGTLSATGGGASYTLPAATASTLGGIKVGANLSMSADGTLSGSAGGGSSGSTRVVYASSTLASDSVLSMTPTLGSNQTAKIQALFDLAISGPLRLIWDVAVTVDDIGTSASACVLISGNTTLEVLPNCGMVLRGSIVKFMLMNKNATIVPANRVDKNITITGLSGVFHGNRDNQPVRGEALLAFYGVDGLYMDRPPEIRKAKQFSWRAANVYNVVVYKARVDFGSNTEQNTDGYHFNGPCSDIVVKDYTALNCGDDPLAFNADDAWGEGSHTGPFDNVYGAITNVYVDGVYVNGFLFGVRLLSGGSRIDNVAIKNIRGNTGAYSVVLDNYVVPGNAVSPGPGNFGKITFDGIGMTNTSANASVDWTQMSIHLNAKIEQIDLLNITKSDFNNSIYPIVRLGEKADIGQLNIGVKSRNYNGGSYLTNQIDFASGAKATQVKINGEFYSATAITGAPIRIQSGATITQLVLDGQGLNFSAMLDQQGTVTYLHDRSFMDSAAVVPSTWVIQSAPIAEDTGVPGKLTLTSTTSGYVASARKTTTDAFGGNVKLTDTVVFAFSSGTTSAGFHSAQFVRGINTVPWNTLQSAYYCDMYLEGGGGIKLAKTVNGSTTEYSAIAVQFAVGAAYNRTLSANGSTISVRIQRVSDSLYLQANGTWAATAVNCLSITDTSLPAVAGQYGVYLYNEANAGGTISITNFTAAAA